MMEKNEIQKLEYGNWMSLRIIFICLLLAVIFGIAGIWFSFLWFISCFFLAWTFYFSIARWFFSEKGGNIQHKVQALVLEKLDCNGNGKLLDIGCGNGQLVISIAKKFPLAHIIGVDTWGKNWEFGQRSCERNAMIEGVSDQVEFRQAGADQLPFNDGEFDMVVSNLVFHEIHTVKDKRELIREALRVLKKNGAFVFQDLFLWKSVYGDRQVLETWLQNLNLESVCLLDTSHSEFIPGLLKLPFMLGTLGLIHGKK